MASEKVKTLRLSLKFVKMFHKVSQAMAAILENATPIEGEEGYLKIALADVKKFPTDKLLALLEELENSLNG